MFTSKQYRAKATEYAELANTANSPNEMREYQKLGRSFSVLADNEQWLTDNHDQAVPHNEMMPIRNTQFDAHQHQHAMDIARWDDEGGAPRHLLRKGGAELSRTPVS